MLLSHLLHQNEILSHGFSDIQIEKPCADSRALQKNDVFFSENSASYIEDAIRKGASAIVVGKDAPVSSLPIPVFRVENVRKQYTLAWQRYTGHPEKSLRLIAVTGTNGKTSVSFFLAEILRIAGILAGLIGTVENSDGTHRYPSDYTTPTPEILYPMLLKMKQNGIPFAVMEASSHAIAQERLYGLSFETAVFTNLTRDHLDYHKTWDAYKSAKASLFRAAQNALINTDDSTAREMAFEATGDVYYYGKDKDAEFVIEDALCTKNEIRYSLRIGSERLPLRLPLIGDFHVYNSAAAIAAAYLAGIPSEVLISAASRIHAPIGRLEKLIADTEYTIYIDYAHTPDALKKALTALRPLTGRLTVLFGAGGDRDRGKRPEMGSTADAIADRIILTNDNPRSEDPEQIFHDIMRGIRNKPTVLIPDRKEAIVYAMETARTDEIILLAGKGHERYLIDKNGKHPFSEREIVCKYLERKGHKNVSQHE
jgi:UDP-N-acetylmuramoyl-L-alanyl-D-glutamate--2,6-diaminopimelate ligase